MKRRKESRCQVLLADDKLEIRSALRLLLEEKVMASVEGEAADADELLELLQDRAGAQGNGGADDEAPLIVLLDWELPGLAPEELVLRVRDLAPQALVVALSSQPEAKAAALEAGADSFVSKGQPPELLLAVLAEGTNRAGDGSSE